MGSRRERKDVKFLTVEDELLRMFLKWMMAAFKQQWVWIVPDASKTMVSWLHFQNDPFFFLHNTPEIVSFAIIYTLDKNVRCQFKNIKECTIYQSSSGR